MEQKKNVNDSKVTVDSKQSDLVDKEIFLKNHIENDEEEEKREDSLPSPKLISLPPGLLQTYTNFVERKEDPKSRYYKLYDATSIKDNLTYTIRVLDVESEFVKADRDRAITLFLQEIFYLCAKIGEAEAFKIEDFIFSEGRLAFVLPCKTISLREMIKKGQCSSKKFDVEKLLKKVISELDFLESSLKLKYIDIVPEKIYCWRDKFFPLDWATAQPLDLNGRVLKEEIISEEAEEVKESNEYSQSESEASEDDSEDVPPEELAQVTALALIWLEVWLHNSKVFNAENFDIPRAASNSKTSKVFQKMDEIVYKLKTIPNESQIQKILKKFNLNTKQAENIIKPIYKTLMSNSPLTAFFSGSDNILIAFCSYTTNMIEIHNTKTGEIVSIQGSLLQDSYGYNNLLQSVPNSNFLITSTSGPSKNQAAFDVLEVSNLNSIKKIFSMPSTNGKIYDIACNAKTNRAALLSEAKKTSYHLYDATEWRLIKRAKWHPEFEKSDITSLDFSPDGSLIAMVNNPNGLIVENVTDGQVRLYKSHLEVYDYRRCQAVSCRWNPIHPMIATAINDTYNHTSCLHLVDAVTEKSERILLEDFQDVESNITWIDWNKDGNLLALCAYLEFEYNTHTGGRSRFASMQIYDKRIGCIFESYRKEFNRKRDLSFECVKWTPQGNAFAVANGPHDSCFSYYPLTVLKYDSEEIKKKFHIKEIQEPEDFESGASSVCFLGTN